MGPAARVVLLAILTAGPARAQSAGLEADLARLAKNPDDDGARREAIALALAQPSPPAVPAEASELKGWADAAAADAKSPADFLAAAAAYRKALALAPWVAAPYLGEAAALEKAGRYGEAAETLRFYLLAAPAAKDAERVRERIGALSYRAQKTSAPEASGDAVVARLKALTSGRKFDLTYECGRESPLQALRRRRRMDCDAKEFESGRWYAYHALGSFAFRFPGDGSVEFWNAKLLGSGPLLVGRPEGPGVDDIAWSRCDDARDCRAAAWVRLSGDLKTVTVSSDRPAADSAFDPKARYAYTQYRAR